MPIAALQAATREIGGPAVQNMATVGGNLFARAPFGDLAPALLALGARLVFATADGETTQSIDDFYAGWSDGAPPAAGLLTRIEIDAPAGSAAYMKCARRRYSTPAVVTVAACVATDGGTVTDARIALSGASAHPFRCEGAEQAVIGSSLDDAAVAAAAEAAEGRGRAADRCGRERMVSPAHDGRLRPPGAGGARMTASDGRQRWTTS